jgi:hypothetical protein
VRVSVSDVSAPSFQTVPEVGRDFKGGFSVKKNAHLDNAAAAIDNARAAMEACPANLGCGGALINAALAIEELREFEADERLPSGSKRYEVVWVSWYKPKPSRLFHRWDDAFKFAVMEMSLLYSDFTVKMTKEAPDGTALEWTIQCDRLYAPPPILNVRTIG